MTQISLFDGEERLRITKPIRLIELFAGYGSQSLALKYLGVPLNTIKYASGRYRAYKHTKTFTQLMTIPIIQRG